MRTGGVKGGADDVAMAVTWQSRLLVMSSAVGYSYILEDR